MKRLLVAIVLIALTGWGVLLGGAESGLVPISSYNDQQVMVDEQVLSDYHDELARFYSKNAELRHEIWEKIHQFASVLTNPDATKAEALAIQQEIQMMTNVLQVEELSFRWDLNSLFPELATDKYRGCLGAATGTRGPSR